jgi:hypothetical protein
LLYYYHNRLVGYDLEQLIWKTCRGNWCR